MISTHASLDWYTLCLLLSDTVYKQLMNIHTMAVKMFETSAADNFAGNYLAKRGQEQARDGR